MCFARILENNEICIATELPSFQSYPCTRLSVLIQIWDFRVFCMFCQVECNSGSGKVQRSCKWFIKSSHLEAACIKEMVVGVEGGLCCSFLTLLFFFLCAIMTHMACRKWWFVSQKLFTLFRWVLGQIKETY